MTRRGISASALALLFGSALYFGRGPTRAEALLGVDGPLTTLRRFVGPLVHQLPSWVRDSGADAAWSFALASLLVAFSPPGRPRAVWLAAGFALAIGFELAQGLHLVSGTFDVVDLLALTLGYAVALAVTPKRTITAMVLREGTRS